MISRHAYLILAHNEFEVLDHLVKALDDERNDIYVHIDARVKTLPALKTSKSRLELLQDRIPTYWGDTSLMEAEYRLLRAAASHGGYAFFHIISGVHMPLKKQDDIHAFFDGNAGVSVLSPMETTAREIEYKFARCHFFVRGQSSSSPAVKKLCNTLWRIALVIQKGMPKRSCGDIEFKASQWCSLSKEAADSLLDNYTEAKRRFRHSFCCDEFFIPYMLKTHGIVWDDDERLLFMKFRVFSPKVLDEQDYEEMVASDCLFARKFTNSNFLIRIIEDTL